MEPPKPNHSLSTVAPSCKQKMPDVKCPVCNERRNITKNGTYSRCADYHSESEENIKIQRYKCNNPECTRETFSIPPPMLLPIVRYSLDFSLNFLSEFQTVLINIHRFARRIKKSWHTTKRLLAKARLIKAWIGQEARSSRCCLYPGKYWSTFCSYFSYAFYPGRLKKTATNT